ncbi:MAG: prepilin-type N-terminal cleavage/methylation domain-containing protein [Planctomycetales bacterium]
MKRAQPPRIPTLRSGFSLFEVLLALALLAGAMTAIGQLLDTGVRASLRNQLQTEGLFICESKLAEFLITTAPPATASNADVADAPGWKYSIETSTGPRADLVRIEVIAVHYTNDSNTPRENMRVSLVRLMRNPVQPPESTTTTSQIAPPLLRGAS